MPTAQAESCSDRCRALSAVFGPKGALARSIDRYHPRPAQLEMAEAVAEAIAGGRTLVVEAGTGTGKTFAYLVPALLSGRQVIVSTGSRNLQDQLFLKDLPLLLRVLQRPVQVAQLKGRGNYLCHYRLRQILTADLALPEAERSELTQVRRWVSTTEVGDIAEMATLAENWWGWPALTSTEESCLGQKCPLVSDCFVLKARRRAQQADLVVINHHLLCADWALREDGLGEVLPAADAVIVDEAHQFAETAARFLGVSVSSRQIQELIRDTVMELQQAQLVSPPTQQALLRLQQKLAEVQAGFAMASVRGGEAELEAMPGLIPRLAELQAALAELAWNLEPLAGASHGLELCLQRGQRLGERLENWLAGQGDDWVRWFDAGQRRFALHATPLGVAASFAGYRKTFGAAWIFTSATLSVAGCFDHFLGQLGLTGEAVETHLWPSPFDYAKQALLYLPPGLPPPDSPAYTAQAVAAVRPVLKASGGRAFFLFTSHRALAEAARYLQDLPFPLLVQGQAPKAMLLARFRELGNAVLLGTGSFWEGVDVQGAALACVIIDRLPFAPPSEPVFQARLASLRRCGRDPFLAWQLPAAVIALKQGAGRLIRGSEDRGVLVLCDPRLVDKPYGKVFLESLPPMRRTREVADVERFYADSSA
ncbi:MAG: ATP-dependent DNA helicase [Methylohalobius sp.]